MAHPPEGKGRHDGDDRLGNPGHRQDRHQLRTRPEAVPGARIAAVGSRTPGSAEAFAAGVRRRPTPRPHASYEALVADPDVDVVYIATPHALHLDNARLALEAGKHVLCEKPLTLNTAEAEEMVRLAGEHDRFLMEAMWMCTPPGHPRGARRARRRAASARRAWCTPRSGSLVEPAAERPAARPRPRRRRAAGHGRLPADLRRTWCSGRPTELRATAGLTDTGIDLDIAIAGRHAGGAVSSLTATMTSYSAVTAAISTDTGRVDLAAAFYNPPPGDLDPARRRAGADPRRRAAARQRARQRGGRGAALHPAGLRESPLVPHAQTLRIVRPDGRPAPPGRPGLPGRPLTGDHLEPVPVSWRRCAAC